MIDQGRHDDVILMPFLTSYEETDQSIAEGDHQRMIAESDKLLKETTGQSSFRSGEDSGFII